MNILTVVENSAVHYASRKVEDSCLSICCAVGSQALVGHNACCYKLVSKLGHADGESCDWSVRQ